MKETKVNKLSKEGKKRIAMKILEKIVKADVNRFMSYGNKRLIDKLAD